MKTTVRTVVSCLLCLALGLGLAGGWEALAGGSGPAGPAQGEEALLRLYRQWKAKYLKESPYDPAQMYVWYNDGGWEEDGVITVSEAHGYGMVITALMAAKDPEAKASFDKLYEYFRHHRSQINRSLMAWQQADNGHAILDVNGVDSATDGDMDIAYALLLAHKAWGSAGEIDYLAQARKVMDAIMESEVNQTAWTMMVGDWARAGDLLTRSSDFMPQHLKAFARATGDERWNKVLDQGYAIAQSMFARHSPQTGLLPDFLRAKDGVYQPAGPGALEGANDGAYSYNACRFPWRLATDALTTGEGRALEQLGRLNEWIQGETGHDPGKIMAGYTLEGKALEDYWDLSFTAPLMVSAMVRPQDAEWFSALWDFNISVPTDEDVYYGNTLRLLSTLVVTGNWVEP